MEEVNPVNPKFYGKFILSDGHTFIYSDTNEIMRTANRIIEFVGYYKDLCKEIEINNSILKNTIAGIKDIWIIDAEEILEKLRKAIDDTTVEGYDILDSSEIFKKKLHEKFQEYNIRLYNTEYSRIQSEIARANSGSNIGRTVKLASLQNDMQLIKRAGIIIDGYNSSYQAPRNSMYYNKRECS